VTPLDAYVVATPIGPLAVLVTPEDGVARASGFTPVTDVASRLVPDLKARGVRTASRGPVADAVAAYADGRLEALDAVEVAQPGGPFLQSAWLAMRAVPPGTTTTYTALAAAAGRPRAVRAAGSACARNLLAPFVPCHRVLRSGGSMGGYYFGLGAKERLLRHEGALL
jgi:methylated-DNA-[protein]-cysteine S-methyltransferase